MKSKLENFLQYTYIKRMIKTDYHLPLIDNEENVNFNKSEDLRVIWNTFHHYSIKSPIKMDEITKSNFKIKLFMLNNFIYITLDTVNNTVKKNSFSKNLIKMAKVK